MPMSTVPRIAGIRGHETIVDPHEAGAVLVGTPCKHSPADASWRIMVAPYAKPDARRALFQLLSTGLAFTTVMAAMFVALDYGILSRDASIPDRGDIAGATFYVPARLRPWLVLRSALG